jgi:hypothetical protein
MAALTLAFVLLPYIPALLPYRATSAYTGSSGAKEPDPPCWL